MKSEIIEYALVSTVAAVLVACGEGELRIGPLFSAPEVDSTVEGEIEIELAPVAASTDVVLFYADGVIFAHDVFPPYGAVLDTRDLEDGQAEIRAHIHDGGGVSAAIVRVLVDNAGPQILIRAPELNACVPGGGAMLIEAEVDDTAGVDRVEFRVDAEPVAVFAGPPYRFSLPAPAVPQWQVTVAAENARGRITSETREVSVCAGESP